MKTLRIDEIEPIPVVDDPKERRAARAVEDGTTVLAIGGGRGERFQVSPWEFRFAAAPAVKAERYADAERLIREGLELHPGKSGDPQFPR